MRGAEGEAKGRVLCGWGGAWMEEQHRESAATGL